MDSKLHKQIILAIIALCFITYGNTMFNNYGLDDEYVIVNNKKIEEGIKGIPHLLTSHYSIDKEQQYGYRPITLITFAIEYQFFGANPAISHLINILLYTLTCIVLFNLLLRLFREHHWMLSAITVGLFIIHPIHTEVVSNVKSRDELLCFLFALLSLKHFVQYVDRKKVVSILFGILFLVLSLLSKPSSITFFVIIPLTVYYFTDLQWKKIGTIIASLIGFVILVRIGAAFVVDGTAEINVRHALFFENPLYENRGTFFSRIPMAFFTIGYYLKLLLFPHPLVCYYGFDQVPIVGWNNFLGWVGILFVLPIASYAIYQIKEKSILSFGILYFLIAISMFSNLVRPAVGIIAERFVYLPSLGFCIVLAYLILRLFKLNNKQIAVSFSKYSKMYVFAFVVLLICSVRVVYRNNNWKDPVTLLQHDIAYLEKSVKANTMLADMLFVKYNSTTDEKLRNELSGKVIEHYNQAITIYPEHIHAINNLGVLYANIGQYEKAIKQIRKAISLGANSPENYFNLAAAYEISGDVTTAINLYHKTIELDSKYDPARKRLEFLTGTNN